MKRTLFSVLALSLLTASAQAEITVYSDRPTSRLQPAIDKFTAQTGETVKVLEAGYGDLAKKLEAEGEASPADLLITKDIVYLSDAVKKNLLQPMQPSANVLKVRSAMRDPQNLWVALSFRARTLVYSPSRVTDVSEINTYEDLAAEKWAGRLCLRTSAAAYNEALGAFLVSSYGKEKATALFDGWVQNLGASVFKDDSAIIRAIAVGHCDLAVVNHYYLGMFKFENPNSDVTIKFLEQDKNGVHTNGTVIGIVRTSKKQELAQKFIDTLLSADIQLPFADNHFEYPAVEGLVPGTLIKDWGTFKIDSTPWTEVGTFLPAAREIFKEVGYK